MFIETLNSKGKRFTICHWVGWCQSKRINHVLNIYYIYEILKILENISANKDSMIGGLKRIYDEYKPY